MSKRFYFEQFSLAYVQFLCQTVLVQSIQFCISTQFISVRMIDRTLSGSNTPGQSRLGSDGKERALRIPQSSSITGALPYDCLLSYPGYSLGGPTPPQRCNRFILQPQLTGQFYILFLFVFLFFDRRNSKILCMIFFGKLILRRVLWPGLGYSFLFQNQRKCYASISKVCFFSHVCLFLTGSF